MSIHNEIYKLELEIAKIKQKLFIKEQHLKYLKEQETEKQSNPYCFGLNSDEVIRYSRQIIMPDIKINGQLRLKKSNVLIVGAGGLGCPAALYLAAAGVGKIVIIDSDCVELSNLHRQVLHNEHNIGEPKVLSAKEALKRLNKNVTVQAIQCHLDDKNIVDNLIGYDVVIDGTDNVATRYLLNDACVIQNKPLVSGSALQMEGQLTVYNYNGGPCYRCLFPVPPPPETVMSCGDGGVLGTGDDSNYVPRNYPGVVAHLLALLVSLVAEIDQRKINNDKINKN